MRTDSGRVEVVTGPMFAGKTEELIRRVRRAAIARRRVQVFTHSIDVRNRADAVSSHTGLFFPCTSVGSAAALEEAVLADTELVGIDEAQFFGDDLVVVTDRLARQGMEVVVAGLAVTFSGEPFEPMPSLTVLAESVNKLTAVCAVCGADAIYHQRTERPEAPAGETIAEHIGGLDKYEARCRIHFQPPR